MDVTSLALHALGGLVVGLAISWILATWRSRWAVLTVALCAALAFTVQRYSPMPRSVRLSTMVVPLALLSTLPRFEDVNRDYANAARSLGASELRIFFRLLPLALQSISLASTIIFLAFVAEIAL